MADKNTIGWKLQAVRESRGLSVEQLADRADLKAVVIGQIESGRADSVAGTPDSNRAEPSGCGSAPSSTTRKTWGPWWSGRGRNAR